jgi:iron complex transport system ATP-binding protein
MILQVNNLGFGYPNSPVLKDISFFASKGDFMAIVGTNGVGKSTLLKNLTRILKNQSGDIQIQDKNICQFSNRILAQNIGYVPQSGQFAYVTVFDAVLLGRRPYINWEATQHDLDIVQQILEELEITEFALRPVTCLSGGEAQKVAVARLLAQEPQILLFDEPTSNLDLKNQLEVMKLIKNIVEEKQVTAIVTMHDLNLAIRFANKFLMMKDGKIYAMGGLDIITTENIQAVYGISSDILYHGDIPIIVPLDTMQ